MRLALIYDAAYPWLKGGGEKALWDIAREMHRLGHEVHCYSLQFWEGPSCIEREGITLHGVSRARGLYNASGRRNVLEPVRFALGLFRALWREERRFDLINCTVFPYFSVLSLFLVRLLRRQQTPWILNWLEVWGREYWISYLGSRWKGSIGFAIEWLCARSCNQHLVISSLQARRLHSLLGVAPEAIHVIPRGLDAGLEQHETMKVPRRAVHAGRLFSYKNVATVVRAWPAVLAQHPEATLQIIGDGPERAGIAAVIKELKLERSVFLLPPQEQWTDVIDCIAKAELFLQPSTREGQGVTTLEAMALGTVVVASAHPESAISDYLRDGENGAAVSDWADPAAWARVVATLFDDTSLRRRFAEAGRLTARDFEWQRSITPRLERLFLEREQAQPAKVKAEACTSE